MPNITLTYRIYDSYDYKDPKDYPFDVCYDADDVADYLAGFMKGPEPDDATDAFIEGAKEMARYIVTTYDMDDILADDDEFIEFLKERYRDEFEEALRDGAYGGRD